VDVEVGAFREVLPQQPVGVLVAAPLPGAGRVAEVDREVGGEADLGVFAQLALAYPERIQPYL
jgi:hypothetical protein